MCIPFLLLIALANHAHLLSTCLAGENGTLYSEGRAYKRALKLVASPQSTALHPTGNISAEDSVCKNKIGHNSTLGIVSPFVIFPAEILLHKVYISNILCGLKLLIQDVYSKEKLSLAMSISTSNEHILDKLMVKICGLTICFIRVSVQWLTC
jgi:hypothetical protein